MIGLLLFIASIILLAILLLPCFVYGIIKDRLNDGSYFLALSEAIDRFGNVLCAPLFNGILIDKYGYKFGKGKETISSVLGKNILSQSLTKIGLFLSKILDTLQRNGNYILI